MPREQGRGETLEAESSTDSLGDGTSLAVERVDEANPETEWKVLGNVVLIIFFVCQFLMPYSRPQTPRTHTH